MPSSKINIGAKWAKEHDRSMGVLHVMRGHTPLGVMNRVKPEAALRDAFDAYQKFESGFFASRTHVDAMRMLMLFEACPMRGGKKEVA